MKKLRIRKRFILIIFCTIVLTMLFAPVYSNHLVSGLYNSLYANNVARVSFYNRGASSNSVEITDVKTSAPYEVEYPENCKSKVGQCGAVNITITGKWQAFKGKIKLKGNGKFSVYLRGARMRDDNGKLYPVPVDYRFAYVNEEKFLDGRQAFEHDEPCEYTFDGKDGEVIKFSVEARKHHFSWFDLLQFYSFNPLLFLSVLILAFFVSYKLVQYVSKFKISEANSRIDIVFVVTFVLLLFLPMSHISPAKKSVHENRMLASYPELFDDVLNLEYGKQFETWFNDRFRGRSIVIDLYTLLKRNINKYYSVGRHSVYLDDWSLSSDQVDNTLSEDDLKQIEKGVNRFSKYCKKHSIKCYIMLVPRKLEFAKDKVFRVTKEQDRAQTVAEYFNNKGPMKVLYPLSAMKEADAQDMVYYKTDHHWTPWGAFAGYNVLIKAIKQDFPNTKAVTEDEYNISYSPLVVGDYKGKMWEGWACRGLNLEQSVCPLNVNYKYYQHKQENALQNQRHDLDNDFHFAAAPNKEKVMLIGNSFVENISYFTAYTFENVLKRRCNFKVNDLKLSRFKPEIEKEKPDILIVLIHSEYINHLQDLKD